MNKPVLPLTYEQLDHWIESLQPALLAERFTMAIGILRGQMTVGDLTMATGYLVALQQPLNFPLTVYGLDRAEASMVKITRGLSATLASCLQEQKDR